MMLSSHTMALWEILSTSHILTSEETQAQRPIQAHTVGQYAEGSSVLWDSKDEELYLR